MVVWGVGEVLWDIFPDAERLGGAPLNFCANMQRLGDAAFLVSAIGRDIRGEAVLKHLSDLNFSSKYIQTIGDLPTGTALIGTNSLGEPDFSITRPAAFDRLGHVEEAQLDTKSVEWLYFGTLVQTEPAVEEFTTKLATSLPVGRCFYDVNLRQGHWNFALVERLSRLASILKLNSNEAETLYRRGHDCSRFSLEEFAATWANRYGLDVICITLGPAGVLIYQQGTAHQFAGYRVSVVDTVGAGDAFSAGFLHGYQRGWPLAQSARFANALGALVASRAGATPVWSFNECEQLMRVQQLES